MRRELVIVGACMFIMGFSLGFVIAWRPRTNSPNAQLNVSTPRPVTAPVAGPTEIEQLEKALAADSTNRPALVKLGNLTMDAGRYREAIHAYERALAISRDPDVETDLGVCYRHDGQADRALQLFRDVHKRNPQHWQSLYNEAVTLADLGRTEEARRVASKLRTLRPADPTIDQLEGALRGAQSAR